MVIEPELYEYGSLDDGDDDEDDDEDDEEEDFVIKHRLRTLWKEWHWEDEGGGGGRDDDDEWW